MAITMRRRIVLLKWLDVVALAIAGAAGGGVVVWPIPRWRIPSLFEQLSAVVVVGLLVD